MARYCRTSWSMLPEKTLAALKETANVSNKRAVTMMEKRGCKVETPLAQIKKMALRRIGKKNIELHVTNKFPTNLGVENVGNCDGLAVTWKEGKAYGPYYSIYLHELLKFHHPRYVQDVIDHEMDHLKVHKRIYKRPW